MTQEGALEGLVFISPFTLRPFYFQMDPYLPAIDHSDQID